MRRITVLIASALINASTIPAVAAECTSMKNLGVSCARFASVNSKQVDTADNEKICRAYAASFYESEMWRQAADRVHGAQMLTALHSVINAFNELLATKCGS